MFRLVINRMQSTADLAINLRRFCAHEPVDALRGGLPVLPQHLWRGEYGPWPRPRPCRCFDFSQSGLGYRDILGVFDSDITECMHHHREWVQYRGIVIIARCNYRTVMKTSAHVCTLASPVIMGVHGAAVHAAPSLVIAKPGGLICMDCYLIIACLFCNLHRTRENKCAVHPRLFPWKLICEKLRKDRNFATTCNCFN